MLLVTDQDRAAGFRDHRVRTADGNFELLRVHQPNPTKVEEILGKSLITEAVFQFLEDVLRTDRAGVFRVHPSSYPDIFFIGSGLIGLEKQAERVSRDIGRRMIEESLAAFPGSGERGLS